MLSYHLEPAKESPIAVSKGPQGKEKSTFSKTSSVAVHLFCDAIWKMMSSTLNDKLYFAIVKNSEDNEAQLDIVCSF